MYSPYLALMRRGYRLHLCLLSAGSGDGAMRLSAIDKVGKKAHCASRGASTVRGGFAHHTLISGRASLLCVSAAIVAQAAIILLTSEDAFQRA
jgi:hypothetical protein